MSAVWDWQAGGTNFPLLSVASIVRAVRRYPEFSESQLVELLLAVRAPYLVSGFSSEFFQCLEPLVAGEEARFIASDGDFMRRLPLVPETGRRDITPFVRFLEDKAQLGLDPGFCLAPTSSRRRR